MRRLRVLRRAGDRRRRALIVDEGPTCFVILNLYPYNCGHLMVVPRRHVGTLAALERDELTELAR